MMNARIVIGKNFGDEGKGLAVDYFSQLAAVKQQPCLVVRHNGGAQAGHSVDLPDRRFVFHQLSSGSFRGADTFWADTFLPDLYKLSEEIQAFSTLSSQKPRILSFGGCRCVIIDDVLLNMAIETSRGERRHGSCGMGINESVVRSQHEAYRLSLAALKALRADALYRTLQRIRREYLPLRLSELGLSLKDSSEFIGLLQNDNVLYNAAEAMCRNAEQVELIGKEDLLPYREVIFEGAQGLLLDENYLDFAPYLTTSRTGLRQPLGLCRNLFPHAAAQAVYVTRTYVTRHGRGPLPHEGGFDLRRYPVHDRTNLPNEWQESLRFAPHGSPQAFLTPLLEDSKGSDVSRSVMLTHLNETDWKIITADGALTVDEWASAFRIRRYFDRIYLSDSPYSCDIREM